MSLQLSEDRENTFPFRSDDSANTDYSCRMPNGSPRDYIWEPAGLHLGAGGIAFGSPRDYIWKPAGLHLESGIQNAKKPDPQ